MAVDPQQTIKPKSKVWLQYLLCIAWADSGNDITINDACFHIVYLPPKLDTFGLEIGMIQSNPLHTIPGENTLKGKIMDRKNGTKIREHLSRPECSQRRMPVIEMQNVYRIQLCHDHQCFGEEPKPEIIVRIITFFIPIGRWSTTKHRLINEESFYTLVETIIESNLIERITLSELE